jgi:hypothetical protein
MKPLANNRELYEYLLRLASVLATRGRGDLSELATLASRHGAGMPTEFLGESRVALRSVLKNENGVLNDIERAEALNVLKQLDDALERR